MSSLYLLSLQVLPIFSIFPQIQSQDSRFFFHCDCVHPHTYTRTHTQLHTTHAHSHPYTPTHTHTLFSFLFFFHAITSFSYYLVKSVATSKILTDPKISSGADFENSFVIGKIGLFLFLGPWADTFFSTFNIVNNIHYFIIERSCQIVRLWCMTWIHFIGPTGYWVDRSSVERIFATGYFV